MLKKLIAKTITILTEILHLLLGLFISEERLLEWKPIHLCWWFEANGLEIPKYFIAGTSPPIVVTYAASNIASDSALLNGEITDQGDAAVSGAGFVISETSVNSNPEIGGTGVTQIQHGTPAVEAFSETADGLSTSTNYSYQAYGINSKGTAYGGVETFNTTATYSEASSVKSNIVTTDTSDNEVKANILRVDETQDNSSKARIVVIDTYSKASSVRASVRAAPGQWVIANLTEAGSIEYTKDNSVIADIYVAVITYEKDSSTKANILRSGEKQDNKAKASIVATESNDSEAKSNILRGYTKDNKARANIVAEGQQANYVKANILRTDETQDNRAKANIVSEETNNISSKGHVSNGFGFYTDFPGVALPSFMEDVSSGSGSVTVAGSELVLTSLGGGSDDAVTVTKGTYNLVDKEVVVQVNTTDQDYWLMIAPEKVTGDPASIDDWYRIGINDVPQVLAQKKKDGGGSSSLGTDNVPTPPFFLRLRVTGSTIYLEHSTDDSSYTTVGSETWDLGVPVNNDMYFYVAQTWNAATSEFEDYTLRNRSSNGSSAKAWIVAIEEHDNESKSNIVSETTKDNSAKASIKAAFQQPSSTKSNIFRVDEEQDNEVKSSIIRTEDQDNNAKAWLLRTEASDNSVKSNIKATQTKDNESRANILSAGQEPNNVKANIFRQDETQDNESKSSIYRTELSENKAKSSIVRAEAQDNEAKASIVATTSSSNKTKANIEASQDQPSSSRSNILRVDEVFENESKASIYRTETSENQSLANIFKETTKDSYARASIKGAFQQASYSKANVLRIDELQDNSSKSSIVRTETQDNEAKSWIYRIETSANQAKSNIEATQTKDDSAKANLEVVGQQFNYSKSNVLKTLYNGDGKDFIRYDADALPQNSIPMWTKTSAGSPTETINSGILEIEGLNQNDYLFYDDMFPAFSRTAGWTIEFRVKVDSNIDTYYQCSLDAGDGTNYLLFGLKDDECLLEWNTNYDSVFALDGTAYHTYRITVLNDTAILYVDGIKRIEVTESTPLVTYTEINFGMMSAVESGKTVKEYWDHLYWRNDGDYGPESDVAKASIVRTETYDNSTKAWIYRTESYDSEAKSNIKTTYAKDSSVKVNIEAEGQQASYSKANVLREGENYENKVKASIYRTESHESDSKASIERTVVSSTSAKANILRVDEANDNKPKSNILRAGEKQNNFALASLIEVNTSDNKAKANFLRGYSKDNSVRASIKSEGQQPNNAKANILRTGETQNNFAKANLVEILTSDNEAKSNILRSYASNNFTLANIKGELSQLSYSKANVLRSDEKQDSKAKASIVRTEDYDNKTLANVYAADEYTNDNDVKASLGNKIYTRENANSLPADDTNLAIAYTSDDIADVATDNAVRVSMAGANYVIHQYKDKNDNNTDTIEPNWNGQTDTAPTSITVYLQIYNRNSSTWETVDSNDLVGVDTDFNLEGEITENLSNYYDSNYWVSHRIYQGT